MQAGGASFAKEAGGDVPPWDIAERPFAFAVRVLKVVRELPPDAGGQVVARQLARCGTSIGANIEEAQDLHSRRDFARRMNIARSEGREATYWLRLVAGAELLPGERLADLVKEAHEIVRVLAAIVRNTRQSKERVPE